MLPPSPPPGTVGLAQVLDYVDVDQEGEEQGGDVDPNEVAAVDAVVRAEAANWDAVDALEILLPSDHVNRPELEARLVEFAAALLAAAQEASRVRRRLRRPDIPDVVPPPPPPRPPTQPVNEPVLLPAMALLLSTDVWMLKYVVLGVAIVASWCVYGQAPAAPRSRGGGAGEADGGGGVGARAPAAG